ncbi:MAG TPA: 3-oxoacyl-ACP reductase family protein [Myxococcota bacterium]|nr:3-oxoacyl-ACP reductase family protein [Myxococcota bacterium]
MGNLSGKVAFVTGGSRGIGAAIAKRLARDGADVAITYVSGKERAEQVVRAIEAEGRRGLALRADSADEPALRDAIAAAASELGRLDVLVNNAGIAALAPVDQFAMEDFDRTVAVNVRAVFVASQEAARRMQAGGRIITIGSVNADRMPFPGGSVYAMSKAAVAGLTRGLARDLGPRGITVNNVQPGPVDTDMNPAQGEFAELLKPLTSLGRYGRDEEIAALVAFLASPESSYVTGASLTIDGGFHA